MEKGRLTNELKPKREGEWERKSVYFEEAWMSYFRFEEQ